MRFDWWLPLAAVLWASTSPGWQAPQSPAGRATFRSRIDRVTVSAVVRDHKGRIVPNLSPVDFEVIDAGRPREITDFRSDEAPITVALLLDASGSMRVASKMEEARQAADHVLAWLQPGKDEIGLFSFDRELLELQGFAKASSQRGGFDEVEPFGLTSLHDAIAEMARRVAARRGSHRAVVVLTDGVDTSSRLTPAEVSGVASAIDVPVYIVAVVSPLDDPRSPGAVLSKSTAGGSLVDLAQWTGGELFVTSMPSQTSIAARKIVDELRHQYLLAFEPGGNPGWHPLEVRARDKRLTVRARSGYFAGSS